MLLRYILDIMCVLRAEGSLERKTDILTGMADGRRRRRGRPCVFDSGTLLNTSTGDAKRAATERNGGKQSWRSPGVVGTDSMVKGNKVNLPGDVHVIY